MIKHYKIEEICEIVGVEDHFVVELIRKEWVRPAVPDANEFDDEDLTRIRLILELINNLEVNEGAVPIVLHLIDQIHHLHFELYDKTRQQK